MIGGTWKVVTNEGTMGAFLAAPPLSRSKPLVLPPLHRMRTPRRSRYITLSARSLESYREGMRFSDASPRSSSQGQSAEERPPQNPKSKISLVKALVKMSVASHDTCEFLVRKGCVRVNGVVVKDVKARIGRYKDNIIVNGTNYGTYEESLQESDTPADSERDKGFLPRTQRDFNRGYLEDDESRRKFSRRVDGGFYSNKRYPYGK